MATASPRRRPVSSSGMATPPTDRKAVQITVLHPQRPSYARQAMAAFALAVIIVLVTALGFWAYAAWHGVRLR